LEIKPNNTDSRRSDRIDLSKKVRYIGAQYAHDTTQGTKYIWGFLSESDIWVAGAEARGAPRFDVKGATAAGGGRSWVMAGGSAYAGSRPLPEVAGSRP
jgi:hypothetical protein